MTQKSRKLDNIRGDTKWCPRCELWVAFEDFTKNVGAKSGLAVYCKSCGRDRWNSKTRDEKRAMAYKYNYGITLEQYNQLLSNQNFCCAICHASEPGGKNDRFHLDHDHITGHVRGLLCHKCNLGLGLFNDSKDILKAAISYLDG